MTAIDADLHSFDIGPAVEAIGDELNAQGLDVRTFTADNCRHLKVDNVPSTVADLFIYSTGIVDLDYHSFDGTPHDPRRMTAITLAILADPGAPDAAATARDPHLNFLDSIGSATEEVGLSVTFATYGPDKARSTVHDEVDITNPAQPQRGTVQVANDGTLWWNCQLRNQPSSEDGLDPAEIADSIARALKNSQTTLPTPQRLPATDRPQKPTA